jgi:XTP/dITP diphosphohydrolase
VRELVIATRNAGKRREFETLLRGLELRLRDLSEFAAAPEVAEDATTYAENARAKAVAAARHTGLPALADDSGLEVDALAGAPGVRSARFAADWQAAHGGLSLPGDTADQRNLLLLLERLAGVPAERRTARFRCVIAVAAPDGRALLCAGTCEGRIAPAPRGDNGFGYDPVFIDPASGKTFAELSRAEKQARSHRAAACAALRDQLASFLAAS